MVCGKCNKIFTDVGTHVCNSVNLVYVDITSSKSINPFKPKPRDIWSTSALKIDVSGIISSFSGTIK